MDKNSSAYEQLREIINIYSKNNITPQNVSDVNPTTIDDFTASSFVQALTNNIGKINRADSIPPDTKHFFNKCLAMHHKLYAAALTYNNTESTITDNYITIDDRHIKISEKKWQELFNTIIRSYDTYDPLIERLHKHTFKDSIKKLINILSTPTAMTFCQKKDESVTDYIARNKLYSANHIEPDIADELAYLYPEPIIAQSYVPELGIAAAKWRDDIMSSNDQGYMVDQSSVKKIKDLLHLFFKGNNKFVDNKLITDNKTVIINAIITPIIIVLEKQRHIQSLTDDQLYVPLTRLSETLGGAILGLIPYFMHSVSTINFDWHDQNMIEDIKQMMTYDCWTKENKLPGDIERNHLKKILKNIHHDDFSDIDAKTLKLISQVILTKAIKNIDHQYSAIKHGGNLTSYETNITTLQSLCKTFKYRNFLELNMQQTSIKLGHTIINCLRIINPTYIMRQTKISNKILYPHDASLRPYQSIVILIGRCHEILATLHDTHRPFFIKNNLYDPHDRANNYHMAYVQRLLNFNHNNFNGHMTLTDNKKNKLTLQQNSVDKQALTMLITLISIELVAVSPAIMTGIDNRSCADVVNNMPVILSLYYIDKNDILALYNVTNTTGQQLLTKVLQLLITFSPQSQVEKDIKKIFRTNQALVVHEVRIKELFNKIIGIKYSILSALEEMILASNVAFFYLPFFYDKVKRHYANNKGLNIQGHYMVRGCVIPYTNNGHYGDHINEINTCMVRVAYDAFAQFDNNNILASWMKKNKLNQLTSINNFLAEQKDIYKEQFFAGFNTNPSFISAIEQLITHPPADESAWGNISTLLANNINSIKKLPLKIKELMAIINTPRNRPKKVLEYDATSSGLQMQALCVNSKILGEYSKLLPGLQGDIYTVAMTMFSTELTKIYQLQKTFKTTISYPPRDSLLTIEAMWQIDVVNARHHYITYPNCTLLTTDYNLKKKYGAFILTLVPLLMATDKKIMASDKKIMEAIKKIMEAIKSFLDTNDNSDAFITMIRTHYANICNNPQSLEPEFYYLLLNGMVMNPDHITMGQYMAICHKYYAWVQQQRLIALYRPSLEEILADKDEINNSDDYAWIIKPFTTRAYRFCKKIFPTYQPLALSNLQILKIRLLLLDFNNGGKEIINRTNNRKMWKHMIMTNSYGSTPYGRTTTTMALIKQKGYYNTHDMIVNNSYLYEDFFYNIIKKKYLHHADIFNEMAEKVSHYVKTKNEPMVLKNEYITYYMTAKKHKKEKVALTSYKKDFRAPVVTFLRPTLDKNNNYIYNEKKIKSMFGATFCHMVDASIVSTILYFAAEMNKILKQKNINYRIAIEPNHDCFRSDFFNLLPLIELSYLYIYYSKPFDTALKDHALYPTLRKIIDDTISQQEQNYFTNYITTHGLHKGFVKF
jgi:hypothetical protein